MSDAQEFATVSDALEFMRRAAMVGYPLRESEYEKLEAADAMVSEAVAYAQDRGYPDKPMETRDEIAAGSVEYGKLMRDSRHLDEATRRNWRHYCQGATEATALMLRAAPSELAHELALLVDAEGSGGDGG